MHGGIKLAKQSQQALSKTFQGDIAHGNETSQSTSTESVFKCSDEEKYKWLKAFEVQLEKLDHEVSRIQKDQQLLLSLWFDTITMRQDNLSDAHKSTFSWIFKGSLPDMSQEVHFSSWLQGENQIFWINGKAGSGKSTLMKFLTGHPQTYRLLRIWAGDQDLITAQFFFWNSGTVLQKSQIGLLRSLLFEILRQCPELLCHVRAARVQFRNRANTQSFDSKEDYSASSMDHYFNDMSTWSREELLWAYRCLVQHKASTKFCFFIDGLDEYKAECEQDHRDLVKTLRILATLPHIKLCLSSRPWTEFGDAFGTSTQWVLQLENLTKQDIYQYVSDKLMAHDQYQKLSQTNAGYSDLINEVVRKAQGVFLWVFLVVRDLLDGLTYNDTVQTMHLRLKQFPEDLESYFQHMIDSIPKFYRKQTAQTFRIALSREEPLLLLTYAFLDDIAEDPSLGLADTDIKLTPSAVAGKYDTMRRRLDGRCKGLVEVVTYKSSMNDMDWHRVDFLHRTVRDYLLRSDIRSLILEEQGSDGLLWTRVCHAAFLTLRVHPSRSRQTWDEIFNFSYLASQECGDPTVVDHILDLAEKFSVHEMDIPTVFGLACEYGLSHYVRRKITDRYNGDCYLEGAKYLTADSILPHALTPNRISGELSPDLVSYLLDIGVNPNKPLNPPDTSVTYRSIDSFEIGIVRNFTVADTTNFTTYLDKIGRGDIPTTQKGVLEVTKLLLAKVPDIDEASCHDVTTGTKVTVRSIIHRYFSQSQASLLLSRGRTQYEYWGKGCSDTEDDELVQERHRKRNRRDIFEKRSQMYQRKLRTIKGSKLFATFAGECY